MSSHSVATKLDFGSSEGITGEKDRTKVPESKESKAEDGNSNTGPDPTGLELLRTVLARHECGSAGPVEEQGLQE